MIGVKTLHERILWVRGLIAGAVLAVAVAYIVASMAGFING